MIGSNTEIAVGHRTAHRGPHFENPAGRVQANASVFFCDRQRGTGHCESSTREFDYAPPRILDCFHSNSYGFGNLTPSRSATTSGFSGNLETGSPLSRHALRPPSSTHTLPIPILFNPTAARAHTVSCPEEE
jgi:hypothetical protein